MADPTTPTTPPNTATPPAGTATPPTPAPNAGGSPNTGAGAGSPPDWTSSLSDSQKALVSKKQFQNAGMALDSYESLEKLMGAPRENLLKLPTEETAPEWQQVYERLGKPKTADEYALKPVDTNPAPPEFIKWAKDTFHSANLTNKQAEAVFNGWNKFQADSGVKSLEAAKAAGKIAEADLQTKWGSAFETNKNIAKSALTQFGIDDATFTKMDQSMGTVKTLEFLHAIGSKIGEASFTRGESNPGTPNPEAAKLEIQSLKADKAWGAKYAKGDSEAVAKMKRLSAIAYPGTFSV